ncbi:unnamed protein product [Enterobius vermicularis]|uniref:Transmembrane domain-containing protein n=1 Tax=Enterobius vermicularis TaxID=51028 RepID=A0A0N4USZ1_ENTVE|nr:unnamed protein product [Enterobius vermicularis]
MIYTVLIVQILSITTLLILQILYFRKSIFLQIIPAFVAATLIYSIIRRKHAYVWPTIALSCFHIVLSFYLEIIFLFYYIFKPAYIIMVLNWAFDTQYTEKTVSYYVQSTVIFISVITFGLYNYWHLHIYSSSHKIWEHFSIMISPQHQFPQPRYCTLKKPHRSSD